ncbi:RluA family pseudouridine synthase [Moraxella cuniculi]|uniref:Pseudouridine synthase n=1 Tax=Moraxella cuniculi TaxID=34061 RepID=A0A3S4USZ7_9GAMM|nr:RluA family pseudouridine synthase [Moraxella cuniculi]VEG12292.1 Ribosomal large subunit pseudouridine synthase C [Moraxella cuniculi]
MLNYTKTFAKRLQKNVKTMKNLQKKRQKAPSHPHFAQKSSQMSGQQGKFHHKKSTKQAQVQSADAAIRDFTQVNFLSVTDNQHGQRIDNFLLARLKGLPRSHLYKLIRADEIRINGKRCKAHDKLCAGDVVRIAPLRLGVSKEPVISQTLAQGLLARIVYEDDGLIVLNKPHGMAVHGGSGESFGVIEAMRIATGKKYLELVHRIDKDTSGLLLIAKKRSMLKMLQEHFRQKTIQKQYLCLVHGVVEQGQMIDKPLLKYTLANGERRVKVDKQGKPSQTKIEVLATFWLDDMAVSLVKASPLTGRTHQIRVHMASIGHALLGDDKYQQQAQAQTAAQKGVRRLCLHAWQIAVPMDTQTKQFTADLPEDLQQLVGERF